MAGFAAPFQISHPSIGALLGQHTMEIPDLQRPFAWEKEQARELCGDLERLVDSLRAGRPDPQHFFGTLVVLTKAGKRDDIIDGQQRMTTVTLLLSLIEQSFRQLGDRCLAIARLNQANKAVADHHSNVAKAAATSAISVHGLVWFSDGFSQEGEVLWKPRLQVSPEIRETYQSLISGESGKIAAEDGLPAEHLREVASVFLHRFIEPVEFDSLAPREQFDWLSNLLSVVRDGLIVVRLATSVSGSGYELFESLNARGIPLNALDHLKVWILAVFAEYQLPSGEIADAMRKLSNDDVEVQIGFFEDYYAARTRDLKAYDGESNPKELVMNARKLIFKDPTIEGSVADNLSLTERIRFEVAYMEALTPFWVSLAGFDAEDTRVPPAFRASADREWLENRLHMLFGATLKHQAAYPFLTVSAERLRNHPDQFADLVHIVEKFFFRYRTICGLNENRIKELYSSLLVAIDANPGFSLELVRNKLDNAIQNDAKDSLFRQKLAEKLGYGNVSARNRTKYFFEMLDAYSFDPKPLKRKGDLDLTKWHLEHIVPQNPAKGDPSLPEDEINTLGNLCLLPPWINQALSNLNYRDKQVKAKSLRDAPGKEKKNIGLADASSIFYHGAGEFWTSADVAARTRSLLDFACQVFVV